MIHNWRAVLRYAWSVRLLALAALLSGIEIGLTIAGYKLPLPDLARALLYAAVTAAAFVTRLLAQSKVGTHQ